MTDEDGLEDGSDEPRDPDPTESLFEFEDEEPLVPPPVPEPPAVPPPVKQRHPVPEPRRLVDRLPEEVRRIREPATQGARATSYSSAFEYPVRGNNLWMLVIGSVFAALLDFASMFPFIWWLALPFSMAFFGTYYLDVVSSTVAGKDDAPDWPELDAGARTLVFMWWRLFRVLLLSFGPFWILAVIKPDVTWYRPALLVTLVYGVLYAPMAVLATQAFDSVRAALPDRVFPAIARCMPGYLRSVAALSVAVVLWSGGKVAASHYGFLAWAAAAAMTFYGLMVQARMVGLLYRFQRADLGWDDEIGAD